MENTEFSKIKKNLNTNDQKGCFDLLISMIKERSYEDSIDIINDIVKDNKLKFILSLGFGGKFSDLKVKITRKIINANSLLPTQAEIDFDKSISHFSPEHVEIAFSDSVQIISPIVTFKGTYIIDGHHRWSEMYALNKNAKMECIDIDCDISPINLLKTLQCTIGTNLGKLVSRKVKGKNLFDMTLTQIETKIKSTISSDLYYALSLHYQDPERSIINNLIDLKLGNVPLQNAPNRGYMPQITEDPKLFSDLNKGVTEL